MWPVVRRSAIRPRDRQRAQEILSQLEHFEGSQGNVPGIQVPAVREVFVAQIIDSERRAEYVRSLLKREISRSALESAGRQFDPIRGAILMDREGNHDEACWLVFLSAHFARHVRTQWQLAGDFYNQLGAGEQCTWRKVVKDPQEVLDWLAANKAALSASGGRFGNHRKYESLSVAGTGSAIATYVDWVGASHRDLFARSTGLTPRDRFASLYRSMGEVARFGRTGRFDYLTMIYKLGLAEIEPDSCHIGGGATGPRQGARLLLGASDIGRGEAAETRLTELASCLGVTPDVLEDALCNWQKSPAAYVFFAG